MNFMPHRTSLAATMHNGHVNKKDRSSWSFIDLALINVGFHASPQLVLFPCAGGPGLLDPCEKKPVDTLTTMGEQQREDITSSAQVYTHSDSLLQTFGSLKIHFYHTIVNTYTK